MKESISKYLKYALGEIVLIALGILIAINIDNYVAFQNDLSKEQEILEQLNGEFQHNRNNLAEKIEMREDIIKSAKKVLYYIDNQEGVNQDSLIQFIGHTLLDPTFKPIQDGLIATGNIKLINNDSLRKMLINWPAEVLSVTELEQIWQNYIEHEYMPQMVDMGIIRDIIQNYWSKNDQIWKLDKTDTSKVSLHKSNRSALTSEILGNQGLEGSASIAISHNYGANLQSIALLNRIDQIMKLLNEEIR